MCILLPAYLSSSYKIRQPCPSSFEKVFKLASVANTAAAPVCAAGFYPDLYGNSFEQQKNELLLHKDHYKSKKNKLDRKAEKIKNKANLKPGTKNNKVDKQLIEIEKKKSQLDKKISKIDVKIAKARKDIAEEEEAQRLASLALKDHHDSDKENLERR